MVDQVQECSFKWDAQFGISPIQFSGEKISIAALVREQIHQITIKIQLWLQIQLHLKYNYECKQRVQKMYIKTPAPPSPQMNTGNREEMLFELFLTWIAYCRTNAGMHCILKNEKPLWRTKQKWIQIQNILQILLVASENQ